MFNPFRKRDITITQQSIPSMQRTNVRANNNEKCRIRLKKTADGSIIKEISGNCSPSQLKALSEVNEKELLND